MDENQEFLTDDEIKAQSAPRKANALDEQDLAGLDAERALRDNALNTSLNQSVLVNPDDAARTRALSKATGVPTDVVDRNKEEVNAKARVSQIQGVLASSPILARQMADPEFAKLAHDDAENLNIFEKTLRTYLGASVKSGVESLLGTTAKVLDTIQPFTLSEQDAATLFKDKPQELRDFYANSPTMFLSRFARAMQQASEATMQNINPDAKAAYGNLKYATLDPSKAAYLAPIKVVGDAIQSLPTTLALAVSMYLTKGVAGRVEAEALASGMSPDLARQAAMHAGAETMAKTGAATEGSAGFGQQAIQTREQAENIDDATVATTPEYQRLRGMGFSHEAARMALSAVAADAAGLGGGVSDAASNFYGGKFLGKVIGEGGALLQRIAKGFATEATTEAVQSGMEQITQNVAVQKFLDHHQELLDGVAEQIAQGFVVGGVMGGTFSAAAGRRHAAETAVRQGEAIKSLLDVAGADKLRERSPEEFAKFAQDAAEEYGTDSVYIDAATFAQEAQNKGLDIAATMPETAAQMEEAIALKGDLRIPLGELTSALPGTGMENTLLQHMKLSPDAATLKEVQDQQYVAETQKAVEKAMQEFEFDTAQKASVMVVERELRTQLDQANRFTKDVNEAYSKLMSTFYAVQAARLGTTAEDLYVKYPLRIRAENVAAGNSMDQVEIKPALRMPNGEVVKAQGDEATHGQIYNRVGAAGHAVEAGFTFGDEFVSREEAHKRVGASDSTHMPTAVKIANERAKKRAALNQDTIDGTTGEVLPNPPFFSGLMLQLAAAKMNIAPPAQWISFINSLSSKGVKKDEISLSGVIDWLKALENGEPTPAELDAAKYNALRNMGNILPSQQPVLGDLRIGAADNAEGETLSQYVNGIAAIPSDPNVVSAVESAIINARDARRPEQFTNWRDARLELLTIQDDVTKNQAVRLLDRLQINEGIAPLSFARREATPNVPVVQEPPKPLAEKKGPPRVPKQAVIDYLQKNGVQVKTAILGAPLEEQEDYKGQAPTKAPPLVSADELPEGFRVDHVSGRMQLVAPSGASTAVGTREQAIARANEYVTATRELPELPPDYDYEIDGDGSYILHMSDGSTQLADTRQEAMQLINEAYEQNEQADEIRGEPMDEEVEERAKELLKEDLPEIASEYANDSEYVNQSFQVALRGPTFKITKVEGGKGIADLFTGKEAKEHYRVVETSYAENMPSDDAVVDSDRGNSLANEGMPTTEEEFHEMYEPDEENPVGPEFETPAEARAWAQQNVSNARENPVWIVWDQESYGRRHDPENDDNIGVYESFRDASEGADTERSARYESEVEVLVRDWEEYLGPDYAMERYGDRARRELEREFEDERPDPWYSSTTMTRLPMGWTAHASVPSLSKEEKRLQLMHKGKYQSDGGANYRELVIGVPNIDSYNENDSTHFGHVFGGKTIAWARVKEYFVNGAKVLFVEEIQSQRAQAGRDSGFRRETPATKEEEAELHELQMASINATNAMTDYVRDVGEKIGQPNLSYTRLQAYDPGGFGDPAKRDLIAQAQKESKALWTAMKKADRAFEEGAKRIRGGLVPAAPFTEETQDWAALTMKRLIRYAVDRGLDRIVWTQGLEQVERYEGALRSAVRVLKWEKTERGIEFLADGAPVKRNRNDDEGAVFNEKELRSVVGPHIAQMVINDPNQKGEISGENIKLDDLWPAGFYGDENGLNAIGKPSVMTIVANKVSKSLGGGEVRKQDITVEEDGHKYEGAPGFEITDKMRTAAQKGLPLFQPDKWAEEMEQALQGATTQGANARGQFSFGNTARDNPTITLLKNADLSTFLHESGHFYLEVMSDIASQPDAPTEIMADMQRILNWFGVPDLATWQAMTLEQKRPFHEQFARGFESYLFTGKSPSRELQSFFARFRAWLINVYRQITALKVDITDEVRQVFDRMLATNDEIMAAEAARAYTPLFNTAEEMGATPEEWRAYQELGQAATQEAVDLLQTRSLRDMKWLSNAKNRALKRLQKEANQKRKAVQAEVTAEVREQPVYAAIRFLTKGELPEVEHRSNRERKLLEDTAGQPSKLSLPDLKAMYGEGPAAPWRYLNARAVTAEDGLNPNMVAELFGFTSGDHLVREILSSEAEESVIQGMTDQRMLERYGDLSSPEAVEQTANEAVHNEARGRFLATEMQALAKAAGQRKVVIPAAKEFAATLVARKKVKDIRPSQYDAAETRAAKAAERAKNVVEKATEKRNQLVNHYASRAASDAVEEIEKAIAYLRRAGESKTIDPSYREQIHALLARYELRPLTNKDAQRRESLAAWVADQRAQGLEPVIDEDLLDEMQRKPYREMTLEEFRGLVDAVKNIEHLGRLKHKLLTLQDEREFAAVVSDAENAINTNAKRTIKAPLERTKWVKIKSGFAEFFAMHRKFASMMREMDGHKDGGTLWKLFVQPMNHAGDNEAVMREQATKKLEALLKPVLKEGRMTEKRFIPEINESLTREGRIMVALNMGNEGNLQRLLDGDGWTIDQARAVLNTLTKTEMSFVQGVWDYIDTFRADIGEQQRRITGVAPEWVKPRPLTTIHGEYKGGYIPAKYDTSRSTRSLSDEAAQNVMDQWRAKRGAAKARDSFTKERAKKVVNRPLRKDFGVVTQHISEVTHRLAWQEYLIDTQRLLRAGKIDRAIREHYGPEVLEALRDTIEDIAAGEISAQNAFESAINYVRQGATIAGLGYRITTALLQPLGLTQSMVRIGPKYVARGLVEWLGDAVKMENTAKRIYEKSDMMRLRGKTMQREIAEIRNKVAGKNSAIEASYFYMITKMQLVADIPTWLGQYHKAVESGANEKDAVAQADQAVLDAQSGGQIKDLAGIQRGGALMKLFTNFYSFFSTTYNLTAESVGRTKFSNPISVGRLAVDLLLLYSVPAVLGTLLKAALHSGDDGEDDKKLLRSLIADQLTYLFGTMVGVREIAGAAQTALGLPGDYQGPASVRVFAELAKLGKQVNQGEVDEALLKAANNVAGILFHYPAGQIGATVDGIVTMANGKTQNPGALLVGSNKK